MRQTRIHFLGAAGNVTGSRHMLEVGDQRFLVDCGLHQERQFKGRDYDDFPVPPASIDAVLLTHAHLDHCGYLPKLVREGFAGKVYCTPTSAEVARIVLLDAGYLQEEDAKYKRKRHRKTGRKSPHGYQPLYTVADAKAALPHLKRVPLNEPVEIGQGVKAVFRNSGHILGSSFIRVFVEEEHETRTILFSGDVGRWDKPIIQDPVQYEQADYVLIESTYGDRVHDKTVDVATQLAEVVNDTVERGGNLLIPSFAIERAQEVLYHLNDLMRAKRIPRLLTFLDSPMAVKVAEVFQRHPELYDEEMVDLVKDGHGPFSFPELTFSRTREQSMAINRIRGTAIIIAGSGMCTGGRIKHHLAQHISRKESTLLFVGYQANGTLGRQILDGRETVRLHGFEHKVRARIARIGGFSAHADRSELVQWITSLQKPPRRVFVVHGEAEAAEAFGKHLVEATGWKVTVPDYRNDYVLD